MNHKVRTISGFSEIKINNVIEEEAKNGFEPISIGYGEGLTGMGVAILFVKKGYK